MSRPEDQPFSDPVLCFQREPVHRRRADRTDGAHSAKDGSAQLAAGTKTLYDGVNTLNTGAGG